MREQGGREVPASPEAISGSTLPVSALRGCLNVCLQKLERVHLHVCFIFHVINTGVLGPTHPRWANPQGGHGPRFVPPELTAF